MVTRAQIQISVWISIPPALRYTRSKRSGCGSFRETVFCFEVIETAANLGNLVHGIGYRMTSPDDVSVNLVHGSSGRRRHPLSFIRGLEEDLGTALQAASKEWTRSDAGTCPGTARPVAFAASSCCTTSITCTKDRPSRSSFQTTKISPWRSYARTPFGRAPRHDIAEDPVTARLLQRIVL